MLDTVFSRFKKKYYSDQSAPEKFETRHTLYPYPYAGYAAFWVSVSRVFFETLFQGISEVRSAWSNQGASYWNRMFDKGSHWSSINGLKTLIPHSILSSLIGYQYILPDMVGGNVYDSGFNSSYVPEKGNWKYTVYLIRSTFFTSVFYINFLHQFFTPKIVGVKKRKFFL